MREIVIAVISLVAGALIGPYINWGIEKKRQKLAHQRELIEKSRLMLHELINNPPHDEARPSRVFFEQVDFMALKPHLRPEKIKLIRDAPKWGSAIGTYMIQELENEIVRLEKNGS